MTQEHPSGMATLAEGVRVAPLPEGRAVVVSPKGDRILECNPLEAELLHFFDGRSLEDVATAYYAERRHMPFQTLAQLCRNLASLDLLANSPRARAELGASKPPLKTRLAGLLDLTLLRLGRVSVDERGSKSGGLIAWAFPWMLISIALGFLLATGLPSAKNLLFPLQDPALGLLIAAGGVSAALFVRDLFRRLMARAFATHAYPIRLAAFFGIPYLDVGGGIVVLLSTTGRLATTAAGFGGMLLGLASLRFVSLSALLPMPWPALLNLIAAGFMVAMAADLFPLGRTFAQQVLGFLRPDTMNNRDALAYLRHRSMSSLTKGETFPGEVALILFVCWWIAWFVLASTGLASLVEGNLQGLARGIVALLNGEASYSAATVLILLVLAVFSVALGLLVTALTMLFSLSPQAKAGRKVKPLSALTPEETVRALQQVPVFSALPSLLLNVLAMQVKRLKMAHGAVLVRQGDPGGAFYVILDGEARVLVESDSGVTTEVAVLGPGDAFGEIALLENGPRTATVKASRKGSVLRLTRDEFEEVAQSHPTGNLVSLIRGASVLRQSPLFCELNAESMAALLGSVDLIPVNQGEVVVREGDPGNGFYIVLEGSFSVRKQERNEPLAILGPGDPFGEVALLENVPRTATVKADTDGKVLAMEQTAFLSFFQSHMGLGAKLSELAAMRASKAGKGGRS